MAFWSGHARSDEARSAAPAPPVRTGLRAARARSRSSSGRSLTHRLDVGRHVGSPATRAPDYYPFLLAAVKLGDRAPARAARLALRPGARRRAGRHGACWPSASARRPLPRLRLDLLAAALGCSSFLTSPRLFYLVQTDGEQACHRAAGALFAPWLHSSGAAGLRSARRARRARLERGRRAGSREYERYAEDTVRPRAGVGRRAEPPRVAHATTDGRRRRSAASASPSRAVRRPCPRSPRTTPRRPRALSSPTCGRWNEHTTSSRSEHCACTPLAPEPGWSPARPADDARRRRLGAFCQPYRLTVLHPHGQGFWWLLVEPPLLVVGVRHRASRC